MAYDDDDSWPLLLRTGFGNIFMLGRWDSFAIGLVADAINSDQAGDWADVEEWARAMPWSETFAN